MINLGHASIDLRRRAADPKLSEGDHEPIEAALSALSSFRINPPDPDALEKLADTLSDTDAACAIRDAVAALRNAPNLISKSAAGP